jgi:hypothetical protein
MVPSMCGQVITRASMHIIGGPCGAKRKMTNKNPCWRWGTASRERQIPHGGIGKMGTACLSSGDGARSVVRISGIGFLCGKVETLQGTLLLNGRRKIRKI